MPEGIVHSVAGATTYLSIRMAQIGRTDVTILPTMLFGLREILGIAILVCLVLAALILIRQVASSLGRKVRQQTHLRMRNEPGAGPRLAALESELE